MKHIIESTFCKLHNLNNNQPFPGPVPAEQKHKTGRIILLGAKVASALLSASTFLLSILIYSECCSCTGGISYPGQACLNCHQDVKVWTVIEEMVGTGTDGSAKKWHHTPRQAFPLCIACNFCVSPNKGHSDYPLYDTRDMYHPCWEGQSIVGLLVNAKGVCCVGQNKCHSKHKCSSCFELAVGVAAESSQALSPNLASLHGLASFYNITSACT